MKLGYMNTRFYSLLLFICLSICCVNCHQNLRYWLKDLEYRLDSYGRQKVHLSDMIRLSVTNNNLQGYPISLNGYSNINFNDLIIDGSLIVKTDSLKPTALSLMRNRTQHYAHDVRQKIQNMRFDFLNFDTQVRAQLNNFIYKISPTREIIFNRLIAPLHLARAEYMRQVNATQVGASSNHFGTINVGQTLDMIYFQGLNVQQLDRDSRLYFEGAKMLQLTTFDDRLLSGCCERLKPISMTRVLTRHTFQYVRSPLIFHGPNSVNIKGSLATDVIEGRPAHTGPVYANGSNGLAMDLPQIVIIPSRLIFTWRTAPSGGSSKQLDLRKARYVFKQRFGLESATLLGPLIQDGRKIELVGRSYLLSNSVNVQKVPTYTQFLGPTEIIHSLNGTFVQNLDHFTRFVDGQLVRIDRPTRITGFKQFIAPVTLAQYDNKGPVQFQAIGANDGLRVGLLNGMSVPRDIILRQHLSQGPEVLHIRSSLDFPQPMTMMSSVSVVRHVAGLTIPTDIVTLHGNDDSKQIPGIIRAQELPMVFDNGITAQQLIIHANQLDQLTLGQSGESAVSFLTRSLFLPQYPSPHNSGKQHYTVRSPMYINNHLTLTSPQVKILNQNNGYEQRGLAYDQPHGRINGILIQEFLTLVHGQDYKDNIQGWKNIFGYKTFERSIQVANCAFNSINHVQNWTQQLIRIDNYVSGHQLIFSDMRFDAPVRARQLDVDLGGIHSYARHTNNELNAYHLSPEFFTLHKLLQEQRASGSNQQLTYKIERFQVTDRILLSNSLSAYVNQLPLSQIITRHSNGPITGHISFQGPISVAGNVAGSQVTSFNLIKGIDLAQFDRFRLRLSGQHYDNPGITINYLMIDNCESPRIQTHFFNNELFDKFINNIMSLSRPQFVQGQKLFSLIDLRNYVATTGSLLNSGYNLAYINENALKIKGDSMHPLPIGDIIFLDGLTVDRLVVSDKSIIFTEGLPHPYESISKIHQKIHDKIFGSMPQRVIIRGNVFTHHLSLKRINHQQPLLHSTDLRAFRRLRSLDDGGRQLISDQQQFDPSYFVDPLQDLDDSEFEPTGGDNIFDESQSQLYLWSTRDPQNCTRYINVTQSISNIFNERLIVFQDLVEFKSNIYINRINNVPFNDFVNNLVFIDDNNKLILHEPLIQFNRGVTVDGVLDAPTIENYDLLNGIKINFLLNERIRTDGAREHQKFKSPVRFTSYTRINSLPDIPLLGRLNNVKIQASYHPTSYYPPIQIGTNYTTVNNEMTYTSPYNE